MYRNDCQYRGPQTYISCPLHPVTKRRSCGPHGPRQLCDSDPFRDNRVPCPQRPAPSWTPLSRSSPLPPPPAGQFLVVEGDEGEDLGMVTNFWVAAAAQVPATHTRVIPLPFEIVEIIIESHPKKYHLRLTRPIMSIFFTRGPGGLRATRRRWSTTRSTATGRAFLDGPRGGREGWRGSRGGSGHQRPQAGGSLNGRGGVGLRGQLTAQVLLQAGLAASPIGPESPRGYR